MCNLTIFIYDFQCLWTKIWLYSPFWGRNNTTISEKKKKTFSYILTELLSYQSDFLSDHECLLWGLFLQSPYRAPQTRIQVEDEENGLEVEVNEDNKSVKVFGSSAVVRKPCVFIYTYIHIDVYPILQAKCTPPPPPPPAPHPPAPPAPPPLELLHHPGSVSTVWNNGWILEFKVSKWPYWPVQ